MEILLIRHGESEADILNVHEGRADFQLTELGRKQVRLMAEKVKKEFPPDYIWSSTLKRA
ncbi:MAG: phosphoglycerate mutase family protein, partial [Bacillota bacterium]